MCAISATITINTLFDKDWICVEVCECPRNGEAVEHSHTVCWAVDTPKTDNLLAQLLEDLEETHCKVYAEQERYPTG
jgi:hypothetical protein